MSLTPSDRVTLITEIARSLSDAEWPYIDLVLKQFGLPWTNQWSGTKDAYVIEVIGGVDNESLSELGRHIGVEIDTPKASVDPQFWNGTDLRLFISHLAKHREYTGQLKEALAAYGITSFVAHTDIHPTAQWQNEIETALSTCEVLIALMHQGFKDSDWTDQEVGFAMGRGIPTYSVRFDADPYGFIGRFQAFNGNNKSVEDLAVEIFDVLKTRKQTLRRMAGVLVSRFETSHSFKEAKTNIGRLEALTDWSPTFSKRILKAVEENSQIDGSWGVPGRSKALVERWANKGV